MGKFELRELNWSASSELSYYQFDLDKICEISSLSFFYKGEGSVRIYAGETLNSFCLIGDYELSGGDSQLSIRCEKSARYVRILSLTAGGFTLKGFSADYGNSFVSHEKNEKFGAVDFDKSKWAREVTEKDTVEAVRALIGRVMGEKYGEWFSLSLKDGADDYFSLRFENGKVHIEGRNGVSLAAGLNHYLKYFCGCHVSQTGKQMVLPEKPAEFKGEIKKYCRVKHRYAYNYCTHSYTMAFWGEEEWQRELDFLALNGVNLVLDITGEEEVWRRFMMKIGYTYEEVKRFITGPAYFAWFYMSNMSSFGGPLPDSWFEKRAELARKNQFFMRGMGMEPVLQGYSGMIPADIENKDKELKVLPQGLWNKYERPWMVKTNTKGFHRYADLFYQSQAEVYGRNAHFYATDPFHEGGIRKGVSLYSVGKNVLSAMKRFDEKCVWVIQSWGSNPSEMLLLSARKNRENMLVLDLFAENEPHWSGRRVKEFGFTPWTFCMLNNFGGRMGINGHLTDLCEKLPGALNRAKAMKGIGITPEASRSNPVLLDFLFEAVWQDSKEGEVKKIDGEEWIKGYCTRRYGKYSENAFEAWKILLKTAYNCRIGEEQGAPESPMCARPSLEVKAASTWGASKVYYDKAEFEKAARLLLKDYDLLFGSSEYLFDLGDCLRQVMSNRLQDSQRAMGAAVKAKRGEEFGAESDRFTSMIKTTCDIIGTNEDWLLGKWIGGARALSAGEDDFTRDLFTLNAKMLLTTWGGRYQSDNGGLHDYSNRQWSGLSEDLYLKRWEKWIEKTRTEIETGKSLGETDWFSLEWQWVTSRKEYPVTPNGLSLKEIGNRIFS